MSSSLSLVLPLQGSDTCLAFVPQFVAMSESLTYSIPRSLYVESLYASAVGLSDALWLCPERALCLSWRRSRLSIPFALSPLSRHVFADGVCPLRVVALAEGRLPIRWVPSEPMGLAVAPTISPYTGPGQSPQFAVRPLELRSVFHTFPARRSAGICGDHFVSFTGL